MNFKKLHDGEKPILICNVWNVESARIVVQLNFKAIGTSSGAFANMLGYKDGEDIPSGQRINSFCFITDLVPTILELVGKEPRSNKLYAPITGKSLMPHIKDLTKPIYDETEGVGLEVANSSAYYQGDFKIVKNNIPLGDNQWHLYNLKIDPGETTNLAKALPEKFIELKNAYNEYAKSVGVIEMEEGYSAEGEVGRKSAIKVLSNSALYILGLFALIIALFWFWRKRRNFN